MDDLKTLEMAAATYNVFEQKGGIPKELLRDNADHLSFLARNVIAGNLPEAMAIAEWDKSKDGGRMMNARDRAGATALHHAMRIANFNEEPKQGHIDFVKVLVERGADVNAQDLDGDTPLHWACARGISVKVLEYMLKKGADITITNKLGKTPIHYATSIQHKAFFMELS